MPEPAKFPTCESRMVHYKHSKRPALDAVFASDLTTGKDRGLTFFPPPSPSSLPSPDQQVFHYSVSYHAITSTVKVGNVLEIIRRHQFCSTQNYCQSQKLRVQKFYFSRGPNGAVHCGSSGKPDATAHRKQLWETKLKSLVLISKFKENQMSRLTTKKENVR